MKRSLFLCAFLSLMTASAAVLQSQATSQSAGAGPTTAGPAEQYQAMVKTYCTGCHSSKLPKPAAGLALDTLNVQAAFEQPDTWEKAIQKLRGRLMPPPGARQPEQKEVDGLV